MSRGKRPKLEKFSKNPTSADTSAPHRFLVGDRVVYRRRVGGGAALEGLHGQVIYRDSTEAPYTVEFDEAIDGGITDERAIEHGILPRAERGWFCQEANLEPEETDYGPPHGGEREKEGST